MNTLKKTSIAALALILSVLAGQAEPLDREIASKLIAEAEQIRVAEVTVGPMHQVQRKIDGSTTSTDGICVTFVALKLTDGIRRRTIQYRTFFYDAEWGWYLYAIETIRGGDQIDVVSQQKGRFELR